MCTHRKRKYVHPGTQGTLPLIGQLPVNEDRAAASALLFALEAVLVDGLLSEVGFELWPEALEIILANNAQDISSQVEEINNRQCALEECLILDGAFSLWSTVIIEPDVFDLHVVREICAQRLHLDAFRIEWNSLRKPCVADRKN